MNVPHFSHDSRTTSPDIRQTGAIRSSAFPGLPLLCGSSDVVRVPCCDAQQVEIQKSEIFVKSKAAKAEPP
jgi:hypothetical protein